MPEVLGLQAMTLSDYRKRENPSGDVDFIIEALEQTNPIINHIKWLQGNLPTGNKTTIRTKIPKPSVRRINQGVAPTKSETEQVTDTCIMLEGRSSVDVRLLKLQSNPEAFRRSEDAAFIQGFSNAVADNIFYGDAEQNPDTFNGLSVRYNSIGGEKHTAGHQVLAGGTANEGEHNTSIYIVGWGTHAVAGIYPKNSEMGLHMDDLKEQDAFDDNGKPFRALQTLFSWDCGLSVMDIEACALVRNIDATQLESISASATKTLIQSIVKAKNRIRNLQNKDKDVHMYVPREVYDFLELYLLDKNNVHVTRHEVMGAMPQLYFSGIPVDKSDSILTTEPAFTVNS